MSDPRALLKEWRAHFDPELGRAIEALELPAPLTGLPVGKKLRAQELARLATESTDENRAAVLREFENFAREAPGALVWPSVEAWSEVDRDPRVARMALRVLATHQSLTGKLWRRLVDCVEHHGDTGVVDDAREYERALTKEGPGWGASPPRFSNVLKRLVKERQCTHPALSALLSGVTKRTAPKKAAPADDSAFLKAIVEAPDDDAPRLVYADWLVEQRRVEGEFINLQIQRARGRTTQAARDREAELLATERTALLGPFAGCMAKSGLRFHRGFLVGGRATSNVPAHVLTRLLERVQFDEGFERTARFDSLLAARGPDTLQRDRLPALAPKLEDWDVDTDEWDSLVRVLSSMKLKRLRVRLGIDRGAALARLFELKLESLELHCGRGNAGKLRLKTAPASLRHLRIETSSVELEFEKAAKWSVRLEKKWGRDNELQRDVLELVAASQDQIDEVTIVAPKAHRAELADTRTLLETFFSKVSWATK